MKKFDSLINLCKNGIPLTNENVGDNMLLIDRDTFQLAIPDSNTDEYGEYFVNSIKGHDCYSYNSESKHIYHIIDGEGKFVIDNKSVSVYSGDTITIETNEVFTYMGKMIMTFEMIPNFKEENNHFVSKVEYDEEE